MSFASVTHDSTTCNAKVTINILNEGAENQTMTIAYEEYSDDMSRLITRRLMRLSQEETDRIAHALTRPASETCRSCMHMQEFEDDSQRHYCDAMVDGTGRPFVKEMFYPDTPSCERYKRRVDG